MKSYLLPFVLVFICLQAHITLSATIIITPNDLNPIDSISANQNSVSSRFNSASLVQVIKDYFGCAQFANTTCIRCENNYVLSVQGKCSRISDVCINFNIDQGLCTLCNKGSYIVDGICYPNTVVNPLKNHCTIWSGKDCLKCQKGYFFNKGICQAIDDQFQCRNWNQKGNCQICNNGYVLLDGKCTQSSNYIKCPDYQYLSQNNKCQLAPANCQTWDAYNGKCVKCYEGFDFMDWKCVCSLKGYCSNQNCQRYNYQNRRQCDQCKPGFTLQNGKCGQRPLTKNCAKWNQNKSFCSQCKSNYILNGQTQQCILKIDNCQKYNSNGNCNSCSQKYQLVNGKCELIVVINNCEKYDAMNRKLCSQCKLGFALEKNQCNPKPLPLNCLNWNKDFTSCDKCKQKYILLKSNQKCIQQIINCQTYNDSGECKQCNDKYEIINKKCQSIVIIENCQSYSIKNNKKQCSSCKLGYILQNNHCIQKPLPSNCISWNQKKTLCDKCQDKYILSQQGACYPSIQNCNKYNLLGDCLECTDKYQIVNKKCEQKIFIQNCLQYDIHSRGKCAKCKLGFIIQAGLCIQKPSLPNCVKWDQNKTSCAQCKPNHIISLTTGQCSQQVINCKKYSVSGQCIACVDNFQITQNICHLKANTMNSSQFYGCDTWNFTSSKCNNCYQNFDLNKQGYCFYNQDKCLQRNQRSYCTKCQEGYIVNSGNCQIKSQSQIQTKMGCKVFDWVNNNCLVCQDQFVKVDNSCEKPIDNCVEQGKNGCNKCLLNYDLKDGKCISFATSRCIQMDGKGSCKRCQNSFALINGQCRTFKQLGTILLDYTQFSPQKLKDKIIIFTDKPQL